MPESQSRVSIFLSHKHEDEDVARELKRVLKRPNSALLEVHISEEILGGDNWFTWIKNKLNESNLLLLLFTGHTKDWDWPLYEAGLFTKLTDEPKSRVICLNCLSPEDMADRKDQLKPLNHLEQYSVSKKGDIEKLVKQLYIEKGDKGLTGFDWSLAPGLGDDPKELSRLVDDIFKLVNRRPVETITFGQRITLTVEPGPLTKDKILDGTKVKANSAALHSLFNKLPGQYSWQALREPHKKEDNPWIQELAESMYNTHKGSPPSPPRHLYLPPHDKDKAYYAIPLDLQKNQDGSLLFTILFSEEPRWRQGIFKAIGSFEQLMIEMSTLIENTPEQEPIRILAYTPAIGFLARAEKEWERLEKAMDETKGNLSFTCLDGHSLLDWHNRFVGRRTARDEYKGVDEKLAKRATNVSETLLKKTGVTTKRKEYAHLPDYYLVSNDKWAIIVVPFFLPNLNIPESEEKHGRMAKVDMFGIVTNQKEVVKIVEKMHDFYLGA